MHEDARTRTRTERDGEGRARVGNKLIWRHLTVAAAVAAAASLPQHYHMSDNKDKSSQVVLQKSIPQPQSQSV